MTIEKHQPDSRESWLAGRGKWLGASEIAALFGAHDYLTAAQLWALKSGLYSPDVEKAEVTEWSIHLPPTDRGTFLESKAFELANVIRPKWKITPNEIPGGATFRDVDNRIAATPDAFIFDRDREGKGTLQIKSVEQSVFRTKWTDEHGLVRAPLGAAVQTCADAVLSGCSYAYLGVMVVGFGVDMHLLDVPVKVSLVDKARELARDFWNRVKTGEGYAFDYDRDDELIKSLYGESDGSVRDLGASNRLYDILGTREALKARESDGAAAARERKPLDAEILAALGNAAVGQLADGTLISAPVTNRKAYSVDAGSYRAIKVKAGTGGRPPASAPSTDQSEF